MDQHAQIPDLQARYAARLATLTPEERAVVEAAPDLTPERRERLSALLTAAARAASASRAGTAA